jgi:hypothetical protein
MSYYSTQFKMTEILNIILAIPSVCEDMKQYELSVIIGRNAKVAH